MRKPYLIGTLVIAASVAISGVAPAAINKGQEFDLSYSTTRENNNAGLTIKFDNAGTRDATGKPKAARRIVLRFPRGTAFDNSVRPTCSQSRLQSQGTAGCPSRSRVGSGEAEAVTGLAAIDPVQVSVFAFNSRGALLLYIQPKPGEPGNPFVIKSTIRGSVVTVPVPKLPQPTPYGEAILTEFLLRVNAIRKGDDNLITTASCPSTRKWVTTAAFTYDSSSTTVKDNSPCRG